METINLNHFIRQTGLIDAKKLTMPIAVIGAGGIGSWTVLALLKMGCQDVTVFDFDDIEEHNLGSQIYTETDIGKPKVEALQDKMFLMADLGLKIENKKWDPSVDLNQFAIVISAVDSIVTRTDMFEKGMNDFKGHFIDGRMAANEINLYCINMDDEKQRKNYKSTLFTEEEASPVPCTERAVIYNVFVMGGLIADLVAQLANKMVPKWEIIVDLRNMTMN